MGFCFHPGKMILWDNNLPQEKLNRKYQRRRFVVDMWEDGDGENVDGENTAIKPAREEHCKLSTFQAKIVKYCVQLTKCMWSVKKMCDFDSEIIRIWLIWSKTHIHCVNILGIIILWSSLGQLLVWAGHLPGMREILGLIPDGALVFCSFSLKFYRILMK